MLTKIEKKEIMTKWDAINKYADKYFHMVITERVDGHQNDLGYVIYTYDDEREIRDIPREEYEGSVVAHCVGYSAEPFGQIGGITVHRGKVRSV